MGILNKMQEFGELIQQKLISVEGELEKIRQLFLLQLAYFEENQAMTTIMLSEEVFHLNEKLKHKLALITNSRYRMLMDLIKSAQAKKIIIDEDADNLALIIMGTVRVIIFQWKLQDFRFSLVQRGKSVVNMLLAMLTVKK